VPDQGSFRDGASPPYSACEPADPDETGFLVFCPELEISSQGETLEECFSAIEDAATVFVETLVFTGGLADHLNAASCQSTEMTALVRRCPA